MIELTRWQYYRAVVAKWIVVQIAARISRVAVLNLCLEVHDLYMEKIEMQDDVDGVSL